MEREEADDRSVGRQLFKKGRGRWRGRRPLIDAMVDSLFKKERC